MKHILTLASFLLVGTFTFYTNAQTRTLNEAIEHLDMISDNHYIDTRLFGVMIVEPFLCNSQWWSEVSDQNANNSTVADNLLKLQRLWPGHTGITLMYSCEPNSRIPISMALGDTPIHLAVRNTASYSVLAILLEVAGPGIFTESLSSIHIANRDHPEYESVLKLLIDEEAKRIALLRQAADNIAQQRIRTKAPLCPRGQTIYINAKGVFCRQE